MSLARRLLNAFRRQRSVTPRPVFGPHWDRVSRPLSVEDLRSSSPERQRPRWLDRHARPRW